MAIERIFVEASYTAVKDRATVNGRVEFIARVPTTAKAKNLIERAQRAAARRQRVPVSAITITGLISS